MVVALWSDGIGQVAWTGKKKPSPRCPQGLVKVQQACALAAPSPAEKVCTVSLSL